MAAVFLPQANLVGRGTLITIENVHRATRAEACGRLRGRDSFAEGLWLI